jgi:3'(2'), 5'-bisphosphate nucleotidase
MSLAKGAATRAGASIMEVYNSRKFSTELKQGESPLTTADKNAHSIIQQILKESGLPILSEEGIDVDFRQRRSWKYFWLIDPLDGTKEFINKNGEFTVNIALMKGDRAIAGVIYIPCSDILYYGSAQKGIYKIEKGNVTRLTPLPERRKWDDLVKKEGLRIVASRSHQSPETRVLIDQFKNAELLSKGSSLKFMLLLEDKADIYPRLGRTMEWDTAAAHAILNASNRGIYQTNLKSELIYNKPDLENPFFIAF